MHQVSRRHTVYDETDVLERVAADGELAVEVVGGCDRWQRLDRSQRIVEHGSAQILELTAVQRGAPRH